MGKITFTRAELYDLVWSKAISSICKIYDVPQQALRKACIKNGIPIPRQGHWEKIRAGHIIERPPLFDDSSMDLVIEVKKSRKNIAAVEQQNTAAAPDPIADDSKRGIRSDIVKPVILDPLLARIQKEMKASAKEYPNMNLIYGRELDIRVSKNCIDRAMQLMNKVMSWVKEKGYSITNRQNESYIIIKGQEVAIKLRERTVRVTNTTKYSWAHTDYEPTGKLYFKVGRWSPEVEYKEGSKTLEEQLPMMFSRIEAIADESHRLHLMHEARREKEKMAAELRKQKEERCEKELKNFKTLLQESKRWNKARILREYIIAYEMQLGDGATHEQLDKIAWVKQKADWYDPFVNKVDEDLELVDRDTLTMEKKNYHW